MRGDPIFESPSETARVAIVFAGRDGHTEGAAGEVERGAVSAGATCRLLHARNATSEDALWCDALVLGTPVHMGSADWELKRFIDLQCAPLWKNDTLVGKVAGVFATGGGYGEAGGSVDICLAALHCTLLQFGLIVLPLPRCAQDYASGGSAWGPYRRTQNAEMRDVGGAALSGAFVAHGRNVASFARLLRLHGHALLGRT